MLLCTTYKIYVEVLNTRLEKEIEVKGLLPESQAEFRRERETIENVFILNHIIQRERIKEDNKVYALFVDLKAAFDTVNREKMEAAISKRCG